MKYALYIQKATIDNEIVTLNSLLPANNEYVLLHDENNLFDGRSMPAEDYTEYGTFTTFINEAPKAELIEVIFNKDVLFQYINKYYVSILSKGKLDEN